MNPATYYRWTRTNEGLTADILGSVYAVAADPNARMIHLGVSGAAASLTPDEARMLGVRLIEAAVHADADRCVRSIEPVALAS